MRDIKQSHPQRAGALRIGADANNIDLPVIETMVGKDTSLDELAEQYAPPTILLIDVEGAELDVLRSAKKVLSEHRPVVIVEVHHDALAKRNESVDGVQEFLEKSGYEVGELFRRRPSNGHLIAHPI